VLTETAVLNPRVAEEGVDFGVLILLGEQTPVDRTPADRISSTTSTTRPILWARGVALDVNGMVKAGGEAILNCRGQFFLGGFWWLPI